ncbi:MAG: hypothetical protein WC998_01550 [Candidatus Paceibacterota bacterium]|jgi:hypothetical protein
MSILYKFKSYLPFITSATFDKQTLVPLMQKLSIDASLAMDNWIEVDYDSWTIGLKIWGGTVLSFIYLRNEIIKPTANELEEVILALPEKYKYDKAAFLPEENGGYSIHAILNSDL